MADQAADPVSPSAGAPIPAPVARPEELDERLRLLVIAAGEAAKPKTPEARQHWRDKVDEHQRAIRSLLSSQSGSGSATVRDATFGSPHDSDSLAVREETGGQHGE